MTPLDDLPHDGPAALYASLWHKWPTVVRRTWGQYWYPTIHEPKDTTHHHILIWLTS